MKAVNPYLLFNGNAEQAFRFYQSVFSGELELTRFGEMGDGGVPDEHKDLVAHVSLALAGDTQVLMASDAPPGQSVEVVDNPSYCVTLETSSEDEAERIYEALSDGGSVIMPLDKTEWADKFAMFTDRFSVFWMINFTGDA